MREVVFGDIGTNSEVESPDPCGGSVPSAGALVLTFLLNNYRDPDYQKLAEQWEQEVRRRPRPSSRCVAVTSTTVQCSAVQAAVCFIVSVYSSYRAGLW